MKTVRMRTYRSVKEKLTNVVNNVESFPDGTYSWLSDPGVYTAILDELGLMRRGGPRNNMWHKRVYPINIDGVRRCLRILDERYEQLDTQGKLKTQIDFYFDPKELKQQIALNKV